MTNGYRSSGPTIGIGAEPPSSAQRSDNPSKYYLGADGSYGIADYSRSSQGLTRVGRENEYGKASAGLDRSASLNLAARAMKLKLKTSASGQKGEGARQREVSERRQVGDAEGMVNRDGAAEGGKQPWWKNVTMEEGM
jgi:hypothetical protein